MKAVLSSSNKHKLAEIQAILMPFGIEVLTLADCGISLEVEETGTTFEENSLLKADAAFQRLGGEYATIADDSGLVVDALDGAPGIYSARFGGEALHNDRERYEYLLTLLKDVPYEKRTAHFVSVITMLLPDRSRIVARGTCSGHISSEASGSNGFGYDPVFYVDSEGKSMAELTPERKNEISHRANALKDLSEKLKEKTF